MVADGITWCQSEFMRWRSGGAIKGGMDSAIKKDLSESIATTTSATYAIVDDDGGVVVSDEELVE